MASQLYPDPNSSAHSAPDAAASTPSGELPTSSEPAPVVPERFTLPTSSRASHLQGQVLAPDARPAVPSAPAPLSEAERAAEEAAIAAVRQREAKARLMALRRIEWVAIGLVTVLLGGAAWSWRSRSDTIESRREAFNSSPLLRSPDDARSSRRAGRVPRVPSWRTARPGEVKAASKAIKSQLDAFKRDDYEAAALWQSEGLRRRFGSVSAFRQAIRENYPAFAAYQDVRFGAAQSLPDGAVLRIQALLRGPQGEPVPAEYILVREGKDYRIDAVSAPSSGDSRGGGVPLPPAAAA